MNVQHNCAVKKTRVPNNVNTVVRRRRCTECGQVWSVTSHWGGSHVMTRVPARFVNIKKMIYHIRMNRQIV